MILLFGSTGFVGSSVHGYLTTRGKQVTGVTRSDYDMLRPNELSNLQKYDDIDTVIWCSGFNQNDRMGILTSSVYDDIMNVNINAITKSMDYLLHHKKINNGARMCIVSSILEDMG
jgi:3-oxoacyl-[acyl-carrier protein] reductase